MSTISTHVLDTVHGCPAVGLPITLEYVDGNWLEIGAGITNEDGRVPELVQEPLQPGHYRIVFDVSTYYSALAVESFYPFVQVNFVIPEGAEVQHFHVPLLLARYGYTTYRGS
jgi:5-hydroxyisourate hydrolase